MKGAHIATEETIAPRTHYREGPLRGIFVPVQDKLHLFDSITMAGQIKPEVTIGRLRKCDIQIKDAAVSGLHCQIERRQDGTCVIADLRSKNGLYVNDIKVQQADLWPGMWFFVGSTEMIAVGVDDSDVPVLGRSYTSYLVRARHIHGTAERAAGWIHRSAATIYRAIRKRRKSEE